MTSLLNHSDNISRERTTASRNSGRYVAVVALMLMTGCAQVPTDPEGRAAYDQTNDPGEPTNRVIFEGNQWIDRNALQPVARAYDDYLPDRVKKSVKNFSQNLKAPSVLVNDALQANFSRAWTTTQRFVVNTTVGGAGLFDVATDWDLPYHDADFGQTFGVWGIGTGPSVQLPFLGPSNLRDGTGRVIGFFANPLSFAGSETLGTIQLVGTGTGMVDQRASMLKTTDDLEANSLDYYVTLRSIYAQRREALVEEGKIGAVGPRVILGPAIPQTAAPPAEAN